MTRMLRKGLIVFNRETSRKGVVIDWGVRKRRRSYLPLPAYNKMAESVRVWTKSAIEIWPVGLVLIDKQEDRASKI